MKITIAQTAGFCMGVRRAVEMVLDTPGKHEGPIYTYGPLIHNPQVLDLLAEKGITVLSDIPSKGVGTVLIRAHGVPPEKKEKLVQAGFTVLDATCPRVIRVQVIIKKHAKKGYTTIIVGNRDHPEVIGLMGYAGPDRHVVDSLEELETLPSFAKAVVVAQTTQNEQLYGKIEKWVDRTHPHYKIFTTICNSTSKRQAEVSHLAVATDAMVVVGGRESGNTRRLADIAGKTGKPVQQIETEEDLDLSVFENATHVGITAGASTPNWMITRVFRTLEKMSVKKGRSWYRVLFITLRALLLTNTYVALGAGCLSFACATLQGLNASFDYVLVAMLYVFSMHILNHLIGRQADRFNDPGRAYFYKEYRPALTILAIAAGSYGLITAAMMGPLPFSILLTMSLLGLSYNLRLVPVLTKPHRYRRIRDIPGSKTILIALAWGVATTVLPALVINGKISTATVIVFIWSTALVFARTAFFDILDMQGDRIIGRETIPLIYGQKTTTRLLKRLLIGLPFFLTLSAAFSLVTSLGVALTISPLLLFIVIFIHEKRHLLPGIRLEFYVESAFILAGFITVLWILMTT